VLGGKSFLGSFFHAKIAAPSLARKDRKKQVIANNPATAGECGDLLMVLPKIPSLGTSILAGITCLRRISGRQATASLLRNDVFNIS